MCSDIDKTKYFNSESSTADQIGILLLLDPSIKFHFDVKELLAAAKLK